MEKSDECICLKLRRLIRELCKWPLSIKSIKPKSLFYSRCSKEKTGELEKQTSMHTDSLLIDVNKYYSADLEDYTHTHTT